MSQPTHIVIFKHPNAEIQQAVLNSWRDIGGTVLCEFAATVSLEKDDEPEIRKSLGEFVDSTDKHGVLMFIGRLDGRPLASNVHPISSHADFNR